MSSVCPEGSQTSLLPYKIQGLVLKYLGSEEALWALRICIDNMDSPIVSKLYYHPRVFRCSIKRLGQVHVFGTRGLGPECSGPVHGMGVRVFGC